MFDATLVPVRRALLSVSDKTGLVDLARGLDALGIALISTGGTASALRDAGLPVIEVSTLTGFPEIMDGRVKTLHPKIHGGLLGRRGSDDAVMAEHGIAPIDLLVVNLYPFEQTIAAPDCTFAEAIENIDIGGPAMLRAAAKNHDHVAVAVDPADYAELLEALSNGGTTLALRRHLATKVYAHTARYDGLIANWLGTRADPEKPEVFPPSLHLSFERSQSLRYGENPHQSAALYVEKQVPPGTVAAARARRQGTVLQQHRRCRRRARMRESLPEGAGLRDRQACQPLRCRARRKSSGSLRARLRDRPGVGVRRHHRVQPAAGRRHGTGDPGAPVRRGHCRAGVRRGSDCGNRQKPNVRVLATGDWDEQPPPALDFKRISGGLLVQDADRDTLLLTDLKVVSRRVPDADELHDLLFAWHVAMFVKSNAIVYARGGRTIGIGAGQMSRIVSAKIAALKAADAQLDIPGSVMASDAFFPFRDGIDTAAQAGIRAVIQPGGSMRDAEVIAAANDHDMAMVFTGVRHFRH